MRRSRFNASGYDDKYFDERSANALCSARVVVPIVLSFVQPSSVIDVGCARGEWLQAFQDHGIANIRGLDGDYVDQSRLVIAADCFHVVDLQQPLTAAGKWD